MSKPTGSDPKDEPHYHPLEGPPPLSYPGAEYEPLDYLTKKKLVALCNSFGLSRSGNKPTLIKNIREYHTSIASIDTAEVREEETTAQKESDEDLRSDEGEYSNEMSGVLPILISQRTKRL